MLEALPVAIGTTHMESKSVTISFGKQPPWDPYSYMPGDGFDLTVEEAIDVCDIAKRMSMTLSYTPRCRDER